jgi:hypothetical protein
MRSTKIRSLLTKLRPNEPVAPQTKTPRPARDDLRRIAHELANQLTVVSLSCFKLRAACAQDFAAICASDLDNVETAVAAMADLMRTLHQIDAEPATPGRDRVRPAPQTANVYRLFDSAD